MLVATHQRHLLQSQLLSLAVDVEPTARARITQLFLDKLEGARDTPVRGSGGHNSSNDGLSRRATAHMGVQEKRRRERHPVLARLEVVRNEVLGVGTRQRRRDVELQPWGQPRHSPC